MAIITPKVRLSVPREGMRAPAAIFPNWPKLVGTGMTQQIALFAGRDSRAPLRTPANGRYFHRFSGLRRAFITGGIY